MDPNECLSRMREVARKWNIDEDVSQYELEQMVEWFDALDTWMIGGGFLPLSWQPPTGLPYYDKQDEED